MTSYAVPDAPFTDALSGVDGTGDPPPVRWRPEVFSDPLAVSDPDRGPIIALPQVPVTQFAPPSAPEDWDSDLNLPSSRGSSADRAEAARRAAAARRDAAVASRGASAGRPAAPRAKRAAGQTGSPPAARVRAPAGAPMPVPQAPPPAVSTAGYAPAVGYSSARTAWAPPPPGAAPHPMAIAPASSPPVGRPARAALSPASRPVANRPVASRPGGPAAFRTASSGKKSGAWSAIVFVIILLIASGLGRQILDALSSLFNQ